MKWLVLIALLACTRSSEVKTEAKTELRAEENVTQTVQTGPETITTTTEEYGAPQKNEAAQATGGLSVQGEVEQGDRTQTKAEHPKKTSAGLTLVKRTIVVDQRGPVIDTTVAAATMAVAKIANSDATKDSSVGLSWKFYAAGVLAILLLAGAAYVLWHAKVFTL